jgi:spore photoproduct lyase
VDLKTRFEHVYIHEESMDSPVARRIIKELSPEQWTQQNTNPMPEIRGTLSAGEFSRSKRLLYLTPHQGAFFKRCPGARPGLACCNYFVLNLGLQCDMNCSYCYLQSFINTPVMTVYSNIEKAIQELRGLYKELGDSSVRVGTGEVIDSLSLDDLTLYSRDLIAAFREFPNWRLEFKTKSNKVEQFLDMDHAKNIIVSWSVNPEVIVTAEEHGTASLHQRLSAAQLCRDRGYPIALHIDPMIWHPDWKDSYSQLIDQITARLRPDEVPYLSVGALRFQPEQRHLMRERFGMNSWVTRAEVHPSSDGKLRYDQSLRTQMFEFILARFKAHSADWRIFLCMETPETWLKSSNALPRATEGLNDLFDSKVIQRHRQISANH